MGILKVSIQICILLCITSHLTLSQDLKRDKRSFPWPSFLGGSGSSTDESNPLEQPAPIVEAEELANVEELDDASVAEDEAEEEAEEAEDALADASQPQQFIYNPYLQQYQTYTQPQQIANQYLPSQQAQQAYQYPIWRIHKYNGFDLKPVPVSLIPQIQKQQHQQQQQYQQQVQFQQQNQFQQPNQFLPHTQFQQQPQRPQIQNIPNSPQVAAPQNPIVPSSGGSVASEKLPLELIQLAKSVGITDFTKLPNLDEAMNLLGATTQAETIQIIKELAATNDGKELIKQFLKNNDQTPAASVVQPEIAAPPSFMQPPPIQLPQPFFSANQQDIEPRIPLSAAVQPARSLLIGATAGLDRFNTNLNLLKNVASPNPSTPAPNNSGLFQRVGGAFTSFFNRNPTEQIPTDEEPQQLITSTNVLDINSLPGLPEVPPLPNILIPKQFKLPPSFDQNKGQYIRLQYPLNQLPYTNYGAGSQTKVYEVQPFVQKEPRIPSTEYAAPSTGLTLENQEYGPPQQEYAPPAQPEYSPPTAEYSPPQSEYSPPQSEYSPPQQEYAPPSQPEYEAPSQEYGPPPAEPQAEYGPPPAEPQAEYGPPPQPEYGPPPQQEYGIPNNVYGVPPQSETVEIEQQQFTEPQINIEYGVPAGHNVFANVEQLPAVDVAHLPLSNYDVFKNAPQILTSYGTPALPYTYYNDDSMVSSSDDNIQVIAPPPANLFGKRQTNHASASDKNEKTIQRRSSNHNYDGPQRITSYDTVATGKLFGADEDALNKLIPTQAPPLLENN